MGLFSSIAGIAGPVIGGLLQGKSQKKASIEGAKASMGVRTAAADELSFAPIRVKNLFGEGSLSSTGEMTFDPSEMFAQRQADVGSFFGQATSDLAAFNQGDAEERILALLRRRSANQFNPMLSRLEGRLQQQGRLGLATGPSAANPELAAFFGAQQQSDLDAQLAAFSEARAQGTDLMQRASAGYNLFGHMQNPLLPQLQVGADIAFRTASGRANILTGNAADAAKQASAGAQGRADFWGGIVGGMV